MTDIVRKALLTAYDLHKGQLRKIDKSPYISHPLDVFSIVSKNNYGDEVQAAALLHDSIEDTNYTFELLEKDFGKRVCSIVKLLTEDKSLQWMDRKMLYIENLRESKDFEAILVSGADKLNNLESILKVHSEIGNEIWKMFNAPFKDQKTFYREYYNKLSEFLPINLREELITKVSVLLAIDD